MRFEQIFQLLRSAPRFKIRCSRALQFAFVLLHLQEAPVGDFGNHLARNCLQRNCVVQRVGEQATELRQEGNSIEFRPPRSPDLRFWAARDYSPTTMTSFQLNTSRGIPWDHSASLRRQLQKSVSCEPHNAGYAIYVYACSKKCWRRDLKVLHGKRIRYGR